MILKDITTRGWILAYFIRDDGERFLLGDGYYEFLEKQQHFAANTFVNDTVEVQGNDGTLLAGQVRRAAAQSFDGYVGDGTVDKITTEQKRREFIMFFRKNHLYTVVYVFADGSAIKRQRGYIEDAPEVKEILQLHPQYHVALNFEDVNYYTYAENEAGGELYGQSVEVVLSGASTGGLVWDEVGIVWEATMGGAEWESGSGGSSNIITVSSIESVSPIWTVKGPISNPTLENITTGTAISYHGSISATQALIINSESMTAALNGANVLSNVSGDWLTLQPGTNRLTFSGSGAESNTSTLEWQEIVG